MRRTMVGMRAALLSNRGFWRSVTILATLLVAALCGAHTHELVALAPDGTNGTHPTIPIAISADGNLVAIASLDENLTPPVSSESHVLVRNMTTGSMVNLSALLVDEFPNYFFGFDVFNTTNGITDLVGSGSFSPDGTKLAYAGFRQGFRPQHRVSVFMSATDGSSAIPLIAEPAWNETGRYAAYGACFAGNSKVYLHSARPDLVLDDTNDADDSFVLDLDSNTISRASLDALGAQLPLGSAPYAHYDSDPTITADGNLVVFETDSDADGLDSNGFTDIYKRDLSTGSLVRISASLLGPTDGPSRTPCISADGSVILFQSWATNLTADAIPGGLYLWRQSTGQVELLKDSLTGKPLAGTFPSLSADGNFVAFESTDNDFWLGDSTGSDIFVYRIADGAVTQITEGPDGLNGVLETALENLNPRCIRPRLSADGAFVSYSSPYKNLAPGDTNGGFDSVRTAVQFTNFQVPVLTATDPMVLVAGSTPGTVKITGTGFSRQTRLKVNGVWREAHYISETELEFETGASDLASAQTLVVTASNPSPGIGPSSPLNLIVELPEPPTLRTVQPESLPLSESPITITLVGSHFTAGDVVVLGTSECAATTINDSEIIADVPAALLAESRWDEISVKDQFGQKSPSKPIRIGEPTGLLVSGTVNLEDYKSDNPQTVDYEVRQELTGDVLATGQVELSAAGGYSITLPSQVFPQSLKVWFKGAHWLAKVSEPFAISISSGNAPTLSLKNGDCDSSNAITTDDYLILSGAFDTFVGDPGYDPKADLDGDETVTTDDYLILNANFDEYGDI